MLLGISVIEKETIICVGLIGSNFKVLSINTHRRSDLFPPATKLTKHHKALYCSGIKIFSHVSQSIKNLKPILECQKI
jgi:hypothetical protein